MAQTRNIMAVRERRKHRVRARIRGTATLPRLTVFRSNKGVYAQLVDDAAGKTLVQAASRDVKGAASKTAAAQAVGKLIAERAKAAGIAAAVFDRGAYRYHGRVKALAESARAGGLKL